MFPGLLSWQLCWRVIWFAIAALFAGFDLTAELTLAKTTNGQAQAGWELREHVDRATSAFPFDVRLRRYRSWVYRETARREQGDAQHQPEAAEVHEGGQP